MKNLTSQLIVVITSAIAIVGCGKAMSAPTAPSFNGGGAFELRGEVDEDGPSGVQPAEGVEAVVSNGSVQASAVTDADGVFRVEGLTAGEWTVVLSKSGYVDRTMQVSVSADTELSCLLERETFAAGQRRPARIRR